MRKRRLTILRTPVTTRERQRAQRRLAREIKTGTYKPSQIGAKARAYANTLLKEQLIDKIQAIKHSAFQDRIKYLEKASHGWVKWANWNAIRQRKNTEISPETGNPRPVDELRTALTAAETWNSTGRPDDWDGLISILDEMDGNDESVFYYH